MAKQGRKMNLVVGQMISAPLFKGKAEVKKFEKRSGFYLLEVVLLDNREYKSWRISEEQLGQVSVDAQDALTQYKRGEDFFFWIEANRLRLAYQFDPLLAVNVSQVDPLPHQIEGVYSYALRDPKVRYLIADDAGAGKTIMGGLIIKELQYRNMVRNVLIVAPGRLKYQWQRELMEKFRMYFTLLDRALVDAHWGQNIWDEYSYCVASIDFLKQDDMMDKLASSSWDLVVVDEAHKMSASAYSTKEGVKIDKTQRYQLGERLSDSTMHMLFLTATPHRGDDENFRLFLDLLRPGFFSKTELLIESVREKDNPLFIRRLKEDMKNFKGEPLFPPRHVHTVAFPLSPDEQSLYNEVTRYVKEYFDRAKENRSITFAMMILQRRLVSSTYAILRSLERRKERLEELLELPEKIKQDEEYEVARHISEEELEDMEEEERWRLEEKVMHLTLAKNVDDVRVEIEQLERLIGLAEKVREKEIESKLVKLHGDILETIGDKKLLVFTEFKDTLQYLVDKLGEWGYSVATIHGGMKMDARIEAEHDFKHDKQIMVATEAAGEGINLQFCSLMVNYDIPWNPNRLEQRMGRIHRYGQDRDVFIYNMVSSDTREGQILERLFEKLDRIREALGSDRVFDIIGDVIPGSSLRDMLRDAITGQRRIEDITKLMDDIDETEVEQKLDQVFMQSLATRHIDYSGVTRRLHEADENRLMPEYIEDYFLRAFKRFGGRIEHKNDTCGIPSVPYEFRKLNKNYQFKTTYGMVQQKYGNITFDKQLAKDHAAYEFMAPGHPLLEAVNHRIIEELGRTDGFAVFGDETNSREGIIWFIEGELTDGFGGVAGKRIFSVFQDVRGTLEKVNPSVLWDLEPLDDANMGETLHRMLGNREEIEEFAVNNIMFPYQKEVADERQKEADIKRKYGLRSLDYLIQESNEKLIDYQQQLEDGRDMDLVIHNEERRCEELQDKKETLQEEIKLGQQITISEPRIIGAAVIVPMQRARPGGTGAGMVRDEKIEQKGMEIAMEHEAKQGWKSEDLHTENLGFDIRSVKFNEEGAYEGIRYIEVKARAQEGAIRLSANEWKKAKRFQEKYWLYLVTAAGTKKPKLIRIQNPAETFKIDEDIYATGYIIPREKLSKAVET